MLFVFCCNVLTCTTLLFHRHMLTVRVLTSYLLHFDYEDSVSLNLTTLAKNSPIALAIALTAFPNSPLVALALIVGPLIELPVLALISQLLLKIRDSRVSEITKS